MLRVLALWAGGVVNRLRGADWDAPAPWEDDGGWPAPGYGNAATHGGIRRVEWETCPVCGVEMPLDQDGEFPTHGGSLGPFDPECLASGNCFDEAQDIADELHDESETGGSWR